MNTIFVLIVVSYAYGGSHVTFQEFSNDLRCDQARLVVQNSGTGRVKSATCVKK